MTSPIEELRYALAEADTHRPPVALRSRVLHAAASAREPGIASGTPPPITALEAYRRAVASFDSLLSELTDAEWHRHALRDLDVQGLVGHLIGVERRVHAALGIVTGVDAPAPAQPPADAVAGTALVPTTSPAYTAAPAPAGPRAGVSAEHVASTQGEALAQAGRPPADTRAEWLDAVGITIAHVAQLGPEAGAERVVLHTFEAPLDRMLVVRAFETWIHEEDIRRATDRPLGVPDPARLRLMTEVAVRALPIGLDLIDRASPGRTARMVLTGPGGGTWQASLGVGEPGPTDVRIVADAVSFCRLVANRMTPGELAPVVSGDKALALDVLAGAQTLAFD